MTVTASQRIKITLRLLINLKSLRTFKTRSLEPAKTHRPTIATNNLLCHPMSNWSLRLWTSRAKIKNRKKSKIPRQNYWKILINYSKKRSMSIRWRESPKQRINITMNSKRRCSSTTSHKDSNRRWCIRCIVKWLNKWTKN